MLTGNLGRSVIKVSAVADQHLRVRAPALVIDDQHALRALFDSGALERDVVVVVRFQGPAANGMPELHKLTPLLGVLQDRGHRVALVTDGRMSGASGKVPAAIHVTPEAIKGGPLARIRDGDMIELDAIIGTLNAAVDDLADRPNAQPPVSAKTVGRVLFSNMRNMATSAEAGGSYLFSEPD